VIREEGLKTRSLFQRAAQTNTDTRLIVPIMAATTVKFQDKFLASLKYPVMEARFEQIKDSHEKTFEWIFKEPKATTRPWSNFAKWLQSDESLYWIKGKAGSGKSTLMSFLRNHPKTGALLVNWAGDTPLYKGFFFFWNSGDLLQRTQNGMLRSLLYEILSQNPSLISLIAPEYEEYINIYWSDSALKQIFNKFCTQDSIPMKLFLLVDGLDEYDGDHHDIASFFTKLAKLPNIKICVSSRPLLVFELAFKDSASLELHNLTYEDMETYVHDKLLNDPILNQIQRSDNENVKHLIRHIVDRAAGVFLWLTLTCSSLISGLVAADRLSDLRRRIDACPLKLEDLYSHMLMQIEPHHREHSSKLFQIMHTIYDNSSNRSARDFRFADCSFSTVMACAIAPVDSKYAQSDLRSLDLCLKSRCAGLLEIIDTDPRYDGEYAAADEKVSVEYIHHTAREFLETKRSKALLGEDRDIKAFDPFLALLGATVIHIKTIDSMQLIEQNRKEPRMEESPGGGLSSVLQLMRGVMKYAKLTSHESLAHMVQLVDEADRVMTIHWNRWLEAGFNWRGKHLSPRYTDQFTSTDVSDYLFNGRSPPLFIDPDGSILKLAVQCGARSYIEGKLAGSFDKLASTLGRPLLHYAALPIRNWSVCQDQPDPHLSTVEFLLESGCDPDEIWQGTSAWEFLILGGEDVVIFGVPYDTISSLLFLLNISMVLVEHGSRGTVDTPKRLSDMIESDRQARRISSSDDGSDEPKLLDKRLEEVLEKLAKNNRPTAPSTSQVQDTVITPDASQGSLPKSKRRKFIGLFRKKRS